MRKFIYTASLIAFLLDPFSSYGKGREEFNIPRPTDEQCVASMQNGLFVKECDSNSDGIPDVWEFYVPIPLSGNAYLISSNPSAIFVDRNGNKELDNGELYISPNFDDDWEPAKDENEKGMQI